MLPGKIHSVLVPDECKLLVCTVRHSYNTHTNWADLMRVQPGLGLSICKLIYKHIKR